MSAVQVEALPGPQTEWAALELNLYGAQLAFRCNSPSFFRWLSFLLPLGRFAPLARHGRPARRGLIEYEIAIGNSGGRHRRHKVFRNGVPVAATRSLQKVQWFLERSILKETASGLSAPYHLIHAGAVGRDGHGVLLPAQSKSGKSTLVAALTLNGFEYYSDEIGVLTGSRTLLPFPKAITLKSGGWKIISETYPSVHEIVYHPANGERFRHLMAPKVHPPATAESACPVDLVIIPHYVEDAPTDLSRISASDAMGEFARRSMNMTKMGNPAFEILASVLRQATCYELTTNDLGEAVEVVQGLVDGL